MDDPGAAGERAARRGRARLTGLFRSANRGPIGAVFSMPLPVSVNNRRSGPARWRRQTVAAIAAAWHGRRPLRGGIAVEVEANCDRDRDIDNLLKPLCDALVEGGLIVDDGMIDRLSIGRTGAEDPGWCRVSIWELASRWPAPDPPRRRRPRRGSCRTRNPGRAA